MTNTIIIWDWNGTVVEDSYVFVNIMNSYLRDFNLTPISIQDYRKSFRFPVKDYYINLGLELSDKDFNKLSIDFIKKYKKVMHDPPLKKNITTILSFFKKNNYTQCVLSAQEQSLLTQSIDFYRLDAFFNKVWGLSNNLAESKLLLAKEAVKSFPKNSKFFVIGDTTHDYEVAEALGGSCCLVSWGHNSKERLLDTGAPVVSNVKDLLLVVEKIN